MQLRADNEQEVQGLDITEHGERGYAYQDFTTGAALSYPTATFVHGATKNQEAPLAQQ